VFFPFEAPLEGTLWAFVIFSFAFIMRPIGTALSMAIQRRWGRATKLTVALFVLGTATVGMAFLPSYESIGAHAITLLAVFRCLQGLAFGGSWDGLPSLLALNAPPNRRGWYSMMGQLGAPVGFLVASALFLYLHVTLTQADFLEWGWRYPFFVAFAINVVALFARLRLVVTEEYTQLLEEGELEPISIAEMVRSQGYNLFIGAFAALASYALFHLVTVFPLSWIAISATQQITDVLIVQIFGAILGILGTVASGWLADRIGRRTTLGLLAVLIGIFALFTPWLLGGGPVGQDASGTVTANFTRRFRYTGAALTSDMAWLVGAAFAPVVALGLSARFGLVAVSIYLLSGTACTLIALRINKVLETRD
jgi:MFS family permease